MNTRGLTARVLALLLAAMLALTAGPLQAQGVMPPATAPGMGGASPGMPGGGGAAMSGPVSGWDVAKCTALAMAIAGAIHVGPAAICRGAGSATQGLGGAAKATEEALIAYLKTLGITVTAEQLKGAGIIGSAALGNSCPTTVSSIMGKIAELGGGVVGPLADAARSCLAVGGEFLSATVECSAAVYACIDDPFDDPNPADGPGIAQGRVCRANSGTWNPFDSWRIHCEACCYEAYSDGVIPLDEVAKCKMLCK